MTEETTEVVDETSEETPEEVEEVETSDTPTLEDYQRLQKENQTLKAQKEHFKKKATQINQPNTTGDLLEMQKEILTQKGYGEATLEQAQRLSSKLGISIFEAVKDPLIAKFSEAEAQEIKSKKAQLGASNGSGGSEQPAFRQGMTEDEHRAAWEKANR